MSDKPDSYRKKKTAADLLKEEGLTYDDYASLDDDNRYELVDGKLELMSPAPTTIHQMVSTEMLQAIAHSCIQDYIVMAAPVDVILSVSEVRQPDLVLIHRSRLNIVKKRGIVGSPDLVVEILSPYTITRDTQSKLHSYAKYGIPEYWIVDPEAGTLEQHVFIKEQYKLAQVYRGDEPVQSIVAPCVSFSMQQMMDRIPPIED